MTRSKVEDVSDPNLLLIECQQCNGENRVIIHSCEVEEELISSIKDLHGKKIKTLTLGTCHLILYWNDFSTGIYCFVSDNYYPSYS